MNIRREMNFQESISILLVSYYSYRENVLYQSIPDRRLINEKEKVASPINKLMSFHNRSIQTDVEFATEKKGASLIGRRK